MLKNNVLHILANVFILISFQIYSHPHIAFAGNVSSYKYNKSSSITNYELYDLPASELRNSADTLFILKIINNLYSKAYIDKKSLNRLFDILIYCGDGIIAEDLTNKLYNILIKSQDHFFLAIANLNRTNQQYIYALIIGNPNKEFNIKLINQNHNSLFLYKLYNDWKAGNIIFVDPVRKK